LKHITEVIFKELKTKGIAATVVPRSILVSLSYLSSAEEINPAHIRVDIQKYIENGELNPYIDALIEVSNDKGGKLKYLICRVNSREQLLSITTDKFITPYYDRNQEGSHSQKIKNIKEILFQI